MKKPTLEKLEWSNTKIKLGDLVPATYNPRKINEKQKENLKKSLTKFGLAEIPVANTDNVILAGHQRVAILLDINGKEFEIDVRKPNRELTEAECKEYNLSSNRIQGEWDWEIMKENFDADIMLESGFEDFEANFLFDDEKGEETTDNGEVKRGAEDKKNDQLSKVDNYLNNNIKQIVLYYEHKDYVAILEKIEYLKGILNIENNTDLINFILNEKYENTRS